MKAHEAVFLVDRVEEDRDPRLRVVSRDQYLAMDTRNCDYTFGAVRDKWRLTADSRIMENVLWTGFDIVEGYGVPIGQVTKELEKIEGFADYWNAVGRRIGTLF